jgi:hypothetical protein
MATRLPVMAVSFFSMAPIFSPDSGSALVISARMIFRRCARSS